MATLHLMVGLPCSGKTNRARQIEQEQHALRLTPDEWQQRLFGNDVVDEQHDARHSLIEAFMWDVAAHVLALGVNVILDYGFWAKEERDDFRARAARLGAHCEIHFMNVPGPVLLERLAVRNSHAAPGEFIIPKEMLIEWMAFFQPPDAEELAPRP